MKVLGEGLRFRALGTGLGFPVEGVGFRARV